MNVTQYLYQSPSTSAVQVGRLDPNSKQEETNASSGPQIKDETLQQAEVFAATQVKEVTPTVNSNQLLDVYA